ncbi:MAG: hypothetical protein V4719_06240 [Planctomycetota bacterium]
MSNCSYLCATNVEDTYPSFSDESYDPDVQTIACDVWCVPLLWMALFRPNNIVRKTFTVDGDDIVTEAPIVARTLAIRQLVEAVPYFNKLFAAEGRLDEYAEFLQQALESVDYEYVTIELHEIACLADSEQNFYDSFREALAAIGTDETSGAKVRFSEIAAFRDLTKFPPARLLLDEAGDPEPTDDDFWNHCRVCGAGQSQSGLGLPVPWEPE